MNYFSVGLQPTGLTRGEAPGVGPILSVGIYAMFVLRLPATSDSQSAVVGSGVSWKAYAECMPYVGYIGGDTTCRNGDNYYVRHVPLEYMTDVQNNTTQRNNLVPFESPTVGFSHDVANNTLPNYSFVTPDGCHDAHDCDLSVADNWLQQNIGPLINNTTLMQNTLLSLYSTSRRRIIPTVVGEYFGSL